MGSELISQFAQVFIHYFSNKSRSTTKVFVSEPSKMLEDKFGRFFGVIEINTPSRENSRIINQLIADLEHIYYSIEEGTPEESFEKALKIVNDDFVKMMAENSSSMVGNLNEYTIREKIHFAIGVVRNNSLMLTTLNAVGAFLMHRTNQGYKLIEIVKNEPKEWASEIKLFDNVVSGQISPHDYLLFCNNDFLSFVSKERLLKTVTSLPPHKAADYFKNALLHHDGFNFAAVIVKSTPASDSGQDIPQSLSSIDTLNRQESKTEKLLSPSVIPNWQSIVQKFNKLIKPKTLPKPEATSPKPEEVNSLKQFSIGELIQRFTPEKKATEVIPSRTDSSIKKTAGKSFQLLKKFLDSVRTSFAKIFQKLNLSSAFQGLRTFLRLKWNQFIQKMQAIPGLSKILISIALVCGLLFVYSIFFLKGGITPLFSAGQNNQALVEIETTLTQAQSKLIIGDKVETKRLLAEAESKIAGVKISSSKDQEFLAQLSAKFDQLISQMRNITLLTDLSTLYSSTTATELNGLSNPVKAEKALYVVDNSQKSIVSIDTTTRLSSTISLGDSMLIKGKLINGSPIFLSSANTFYTVNNAALERISIPLQSTELVTDYSFYNDRLYNLIPSANQIYRHPPSGKNYLAGITWIQESGIDLSKAVSLNLDTAVWVATSDGQVMKFFKGFKQAFTLGEVDPPLKTITSMIKHEEDKYLYILDNETNRVIVIDDKGTLITQFYAQTFGKITGFDIDEQAQVLYLTNAKAVAAAIIHLPK